MTYVPNRDFFTDVSLGNVPWHSIMSAMWERESMGTTVTGEDIRRGNELSPAPTSTTSIPLPDSGGEQMSVVSEDAGDTSAGTGVRTLRIHYLDASWDEQTEDVTMNGTTAVDTVATDIRFVNDMYSLTVGSNWVAEDHIKIYKKSDSGLVYNMIHEGGNKSLVPNRMVPNWKTLILKGRHCEEAQGRRLTFRIRSTDMYGVLVPWVFCFKDTAYIKQWESGMAALNRKIPSLSVIKVSWRADQAAAEGSCGWRGILVDN